MADEANNDDPKGRGLSKGELKKLQSRFRRLQGSKPRNRQPLPGYGPPAWAIHILLWSIALVGMLILILTDRHIALAKKSLPPPETPANYIGSGAVVPIGCVEVKDATFANVEGLADGSSTALATQRDYIANHNLSKFKGHKIPVEIENSIGMRFRLVPGPSLFMMGSPEKEPNRGPDEHEHTRRINYPYYIGKFEVTQGEFKAVMGFNPSDGRKIRTPEHPVQEVTWLDATKFCRKLSRREGLPRGAYRLPLESEWEYACRAGTTTMFYWGNDYNRYMDFAIIDTGKPDIVGTRRPNAWGIHNMHGNVWEWCQNLFYSYETGQSDRLRRSIRGGNWRLRWDRCRSAKRARLPEKSHGNFLGFRVVRVLTSRTLRVVAPEELDAPIPTQVPSEDKPKPDGLPKKPE